MRETIRTFLAADTMLMAILTGGIYGGTEISRQLTAAVFDANDELLPCALVSSEAESPHGPFMTSSRQFVIVRFFQRSGYTQVDAALARVYTLLHRQRISSVGMWEMRHAGDVRDVRDDALDCAMAISRYEVIRVRG